MWIFVLLIAVFPKTALLSGQHNHHGILVIRLLVLFGGASTGFSYLLSYLFQSPSMAQIVMVIVTFLVGFLLSVVGMILRIVPNQRKVFMHVLRYIFAVFPPYALADGLHNLCAISTWSALELKRGEQYHPLDWNITGMSLTFLGCETVAYLTLTILYEYIQAMPSFQVIAVNVVLLCLQTPFRGSENPTALGR